MISSVRTNASDRTATSIGGARLEQILGQLESTGSNQGAAHVLGVIGCQSGDGATYVLHTLASALATRTSRHILTASTTDILRCLHASSAALLDACVLSGQDNLWAFTPPRQICAFDQLHSAGSSAFDRTLTTLTSRFRYVLLDCGAVSTSGSVWSFAHAVDEIVLVAAAGETRRRQIVYAQRVLQQSGARLTGCVLNKRTYPLPARLFRAFA